MVTYSPAGAPGSDLLNSRDLSLREETLPTDVRTAAAVFAHTSRVVAALNRLEDASQASPCLPSSVSFTQASAAFCAASSGVSAATATVEAAARKARTRPARAPRSTRISPAPLPACA